LSTDHQGQPTRGQLRLTSLFKRYGDFAAVDDVSLDVRPGEFVTLLGPSGSGKTTTLRMIAGTTRPDAGEIVLDGRDITTVPPHKREIGMVFQNYALFPHMTAAQNIGFPLKMRGIKGAEAAKLVSDALKLVHLEGFGERYPKQLSGGQQQRVAVARAVVFKPGLLLMDEPLGALDKKLREALQLEITRISREIGVTVIYVTHDQEEALSMSDRIALYNGGRIHQIGTGKDLYEEPASLFVAQFIGESNVFRGRLASQDAAVDVAGGQRLRVTPGACRRSGVSTGAEAAIVVRPERLAVTPVNGHSRVSDDTSNVLRGVVREVIYLGSMRRYVVELGDGATARAQVQVGQAGDDLLSGAEVELAWTVEHGVLVAADTAGPAATPETPLEQESVVDA
jgi:putative spermidine/putrescine transport system ATP-binding protein